MKYSSRDRLTLVEILLAISFSMFVAVGCSMIVSPMPTATVELVRQAPTETRTPIATATASKTSTPGPTYTLVIQPGTPLPPLGIIGKTPTATVPYGIVAMTPVAPQMKNPVKFASPFKVVTYPVTGSTTEQLSASLDKNAMKDSHNPFGRHYALTSWHLSASWDEKPTISGCEVANAAITMTITMTLPMLENPSNLFPEAATRWDNFISNTVMHEMEHVKLGINGATEFRRNLGNFLPAMSCDLLKLQLSSLFKKEYADIDKANVDYDTKTNHGATQGAVFP
ncbi:MAG: DUF922 domain-containing protein [Chloroflexi bacterium]|nr:DUF922 domain-containing protein [Chloroflexota bacterium]